MHLAYIWIVFHLSAKNYQNRWKFDEVLTKTNLLNFGGDTVYEACATSVKTCCQELPNWVPKDPTEPNSI